MMTFSFRSRGWCVEAAASAGPTGGLVAAHSLALIDLYPPSFGRPSLTFFSANAGWPSPFFFPRHSEKSPNTAHGGSPLHEYLICNAAISHFCSGFVSSFLLSSPLCACVCAHVCVNDRRCVVAVQAGAAGVSHRQGAHPQVRRPVSLSNGRDHIQGEQAG